MLQVEMYLYHHLFSLRLINRLLSVMDTAYVLCAVRTGLKYTYVYVRQSSKGLSLECGYFLHALSVSAERGCTNAK
jgi:hypothetical protein